MDSPHPKSPLIVPAPQRSNLRHWVYPGTCWAILLTACAAAPTKPSDPPHLDKPPFIKLAERGLGLIVGFEDLETSAAFREKLCRRLARQLQTIYRTKVHTMASTGAAELSPQTFLTMVEHGADDAVVIALSSSPTDPNAIDARTRIIVLNTREVSYDLRLENIRDAAGNPPNPERLADLVVLKIRNHWTDPGAAPKLDPLDAASHLANHHACAQAVQLYERATIDRIKPTTLAQMQRYAEAVAHYDTCKHELARQQAIRIDRTATFGIRVEPLGLSERYESALRSAIRKSRLEEHLRPHTDKPVTVRVQPGHMTLCLRFHPERYRAATRTVPAYEHGLPVMYVEPFEPAISALLDLKGALYDALAPFDRPTVESFGTTLQLTKLGGDYLEIDFAELDGRLLYTDTVRIKMGARPEISISSALPGVTRRKTFVLGPPEHPNGDLTPYGLVYRFLELEP